MNAGRLVALNLRSRARQQAGLCGRWGRNVQKCTHRHKCGHSPSKALSLTHTKLKSLPSSPTPPRTPVKAPFEGSTTYEYSTANGSTIPENSKTINNAI
eukprot:2519569-Amphidinium_carterae.1